MHKNFHRGISVDANPCLLFYTLNMNITLPHYKTKIVCTIGPSSRSESVLRELIRCGMSVARLNFSHGSFDSHGEDIRTIRRAAKSEGTSVAILADLPGPKIRIGKLQTEPLELLQGEEIVLTTRPVIGTSSLISVNYDRIEESVSPGSIIYLNDGFIELRVLNIDKDAVQCVVTIGGPLLSGKGLNIPGAPLLIDPLTPRDFEIMEFAIENEIDTFCVSFVESAEEILRVKEFGRKKGKNLYVVAKIERAGAIDNIEAILEATDAVMIARGDLGVEVPIEDVPVIQKELIHKANLCCRPVITATQMLQSMVDNTRPTRAEVTDVANAIMDGTDAVMLSEETAIGKYPAQTVTMMARIASSFERQRGKIKWSSALQDQLKQYLRNKQIDIPDTVSLNVVEAAQALRAPFILTPTSRGATARRISRLKPNSWIIACNHNQKVCDFMLLSYGVYPMLMSTNDGTWQAVILERLQEMGLIRSGDRIIITEGKFSGDFGGTDSLGIMTVQ